MFTSGFFNSINSDRKYNAEQMAAIFDGLITDGIFDSIGDHFRVTPAASGLKVNIGTGRAWLNKTWSYNDTVYPVTLGAASSSLGRKDLICLKVNKSNSVRANSLVVIAGTPAASPVEPTVTDDATNGIYYHKLAAVTVPKGATSISASNIKNYIGLSTGTPYVTGLLSSTTVDELWSQWDGEFNDWWNDIKATLDDNVVTTILNKIDHITPKEATMNLYGLSHINPPPSGKTYAEYSTDAILNQIRTLLNNSKTLISSDLELTTSYPSTPIVTYSFSERPFLVMIVSKKIRGLAYYGGDGGLITEYPLTFIISPGEKFELEEYSQWHASTNYASTKLSTDAMTLTLTAGYYEDSGTNATCKYRIIYYH